ncbi:flagellar hook-associated protein FlgK [Halioxenophilus sp. WMMB6]|uniref:flagellar hook-associated protein FlgK n=1 Tax=Halioxenophilus sp. WMMB6 TaxID=3073815 RepID=UPI00295E8A3B|nr:flagellar hook-associated protein FlgK [Halioxenophilus sp. WMMB6]
MSLINIALSGLNVAQTSLATTSHNITNANTEGYSRQRTEQATQQPNFTGAGYIGAGARITGIDRLYNDFINEELRLAGQDLQQSQAYLSQASQLDSLLASTNTSLTTSLESFFASLSTASEDPQSPATRQLVLSEADGLADRYNLLYQQINDQNSYINNQAEALVSQINQLVTSIADLNDSVAAAFSNGRQPNDLIDRRDQAIRDLSELVGVTTSPQTDGTVNLFIGTGQPLVVGGDVTLLETTRSLDANFQLSIIQPRSGTDITSVISGGQLGGLLTYQQELVVPSLNELGRLALVTADAINQQQAQGLDLEGNFGVNIFDDINTSAAMVNRVTADTANNGDALLQIAVTDTSLLTASDYTLRVTGGNYEIVRLDDSSVVDSGSIPLPATISLPSEGIEIQLTAGAVADGDGFMLSPTRRSAELISMVLNEPTQLAFAAPLRAITSLDNRGEITISQPEIITPLDTNTQPLVSAGGATPFDLIYDETGGFWQISNVPVGYSVSPANLAFTPGVNNSLTFTIDDGLGNAVDVTMDISGRPQNGDAISVDFNSDGVADNRNVLAMVELQTADLIRSSSAVTGPNQGLVDSYGQLVETVGVVTAQKKIETEANQDIFQQAFDNREEISGVNLDEEAANLIRFEQAYSAASQVIAIARQLFDRILEL